VDTDRLLRHAPDLNVFILVVFLVVAGLGLIVFVRGYRGLAERYYGPPDETPEEKQERREQDAW